MRIRSTKHFISSFEIYTKLNIIFSLIHRCRFLPPLKHIKQVTIDCYHALDTISRKHRRYREEQKKCPHGAHSLLQRLWIPENDRPPTQRTSVFIGRAANKVKNLHLPLRLQRGRKLLSPDACDDDTQFPRLTLQNSRLRFHSMTGNSLPASFSILAYSLTRKAACRQTDKSRAG